MKSAKTALDAALKALDNPTAEDLKKLDAWLGVNASNAAAKLREKLARVRTFSDAVTFRCAVKTDAKIGDVYAYVDPDKSFNVVLGAFFFGAPDKGYCSKPGILVHEISHFTLAGATKDPKIYGPEEALKLAASSPGAAQNNAENFEYFVESLAFSLSAANTKCG
ncbi:M35 family metallo-endopeptidase [Bradyrhizobium sp. AZCC 1708]|uniref:M35 family metallo-endopeptidase n=1 Tax=Bradyrhizobium sp. AZCC 1708 TaxID=3117015 RepID=UPI002FF1FC57